MKKLVFLFLLQIFGFQAIAQNLSIGDMQTIYSLPNWDAVDTYITKKGWKFEGSERVENGTSTIKWTYKKSDYNSKANGWFTLTLKGSKFEELRYQLSDGDKYNLEKSSAVNYGFKFQNSEIENDELITTYKNTSFSLTFIVNKQTSLNESETIRTIYMERIQTKSTSNANTPIYGTVKDIDGNIYKTIIIGNQEWMAENLNVTKFNDGKSIPVIKDSAIWINTKSPAMCWFRNDSTKYTLNKSGALYNYFTIENNNLCPIGWHVPNNSEVIYFMRGGDLEADRLNANNFRISWNTNRGSNSSGFSALQIGYRDPFNGKFMDNKNSQCYWWIYLKNTSGTSPLSEVYGIELDDFVLASYRKTYGISVRCIKN